MFSLSSTQCKVRLHGHGRAQPTVESSYIGQNLRWLHGND